MSSPTEPMSLTTNCLLDAKAFEIIYDQYAKSIYRFIMRRINHQEDSKEIAQDIFIWLWANREKLQILSVSNYLFAMCKYRISVYIRSQQCRKKHAVHIHYISEFTGHTTEEMINLSDLKATITRQVSQLSPKCQEVFRMSREEHLPIARIAEIMNISTSTVENYITSALKHLRTNLTEYHTGFIPANKKLVAKPIAIN